MVRKPERRCPDNPGALLKALRRQDFVAFVQKAWPQVNAGQLVDWNWHLDAIAHRLNLVAAGEVRRLLVNVPPRNGKSNIVSVVWPASMLGIDPSLSFVCVSYSNELSRKLARDCLAVMQSAWYRELFPGTVISSRRSATYDFETTKGGGRLATSITGTLTGRGGDIIILDDVIKPEEANSDAVREAVNDWYRSTLASRLNDKETGAIVCVMQRLHQYDLPGMLLEAGGWDHLSLPAVATEDALIPLTRGRIFHRREGELLHPQRESARVLADLNAAMGSHAFEAQYQQNPVPAVGNLIEASWLQSYRPLELANADGQTVQSWDTASKDNPFNDYSVCVTAKIVGKLVFVIDVFRERLKFPDLEAKVIELARLHRPTMLLIEDAASGQQLIQRLRATSPDGVPWPLPRRPEGDKISRVIGASAIIQTNRLFLPEGASWMGPFKSELLAFPAARFDDQVDALSQLLAWVQEMDMYRAPSNEGPIEMGDSGGDDDWDSTTDWDGYLDAWGA